MYIRPPGVSDAASVNMAFGYYLLSRVMAVALVCTTVTGVVQKPPLSCTVDGKKYPLYVTWPSTVPGECAEYYCEDDTIYWRTCPGYNLDEEPGVICYDISMKNAPYPYCCPKYHCVEKRKYYN